MEGQTFEIFADNQVLKYIFTKSSLSRREARWLETLGNFGIFPINMKAGKMHVLRDALSRIPNVMNSKDETSAVVNAVETFEVDKEIISGYEDDQFFRKIHKAFQGTFPQDEREKRVVERLLPLFEIQNGELKYQNRLCIPRRNVSKILDSAHDSKVGGHFGLAKTLSRLSGLYWRNMSKDVKNYIKGCMKFQQHKDSR